MAAKLFSLSAQQIQQKPGQWPNASKFEVTSLALIKHVVYKLLSNTVQGISEAEAALRLISLRTHAHEKTDTSAQNSISERKSQRSISAQGCINAVRQAQRSDERELDPTDTLATTDQNWLASQADF